MTENNAFVRNYHDLSTPRGFQFEFYCDHCGNGYRTAFKASTTGTVSELLDTASGLFGGVFSSAANIGGRVNSAAYERAKEAALVDATQEMKDQFVMCPRCRSWVCKTCWNTKRGLCKGCAPDLGVEMSAAQASRSVEEVWAQAAMSEEDKKLAEGNWRETIVASCPKCGAAQATNAKFCPECGANLKQGVFCAQCGAKMQPGAKFCGECGAKTG